MSRKPANQRGAHIRKPTTHLNGRTHSMIPTEDNVPEAHQIRKEEHTSRKLARFQKRNTHPGSSSDPQGRTHIAEARQIPWRDTHPEATQISKMEHTSRKLARSPRRNPNPGSAPNLQGGAYMPEVRLISGPHIPQTRQIYTEEHASRNFARSPKEHTSRKLAKSPRRTTHPGNSPNDPVMKITANRNIKNNTPCPNHGTQHDCSLPPPPFELKPGKRNPHQTGQMTNTQKSPWNAANETISPMKMTKNRDIGHTITCHSLTV